MKVFKPIAIGVLVVASFLAGEVSAYALLSVKHRGALAAQALVARVLGLTQPQSPAPRVVYVEKVKAAHSAPSTDCSSRPSSAGNMPADGDYYGPNDIVAGPRIVNPKPLEPGESYMK